MKNKKKVALIAGIVLLVILAVVAIVLINRNGKDAYRSILVYEMEGSAVIRRESIGEIDAYENLMLQSGDTVVVEKDSTMRLKLDDDKYVLVEPESEFTIVAEGDSRDSKTKIVLTRGAITNEIKSRLSDKSSYEVETPNSIMAVRGTVFRVEVYYDTEGNSFSRTSTFEGKVGTRLVMPDGAVTEDEVLVENGEEVLVQGTEEDSEYVGAPEEIDFTTMPQTVLQFLVELAEEGRELCLTKEELMELTEETENVEEATEESMEEEEPEFYEVTFMYQDQVFGVQQVAPGGQVSVPSLSPQATGSWDYDFSTEVHEDTTIHWK